MTELVRNSGDEECCICLQTPVFPTKLPECGHNFCFLCIKGVALAEHKCPMCRRNFSPRVFAHPTVNVPQSPPYAAAQARSTTAVVAGSPLMWFYEGRNGWWQYDQRTAQQIDKAIQDGETCFNSMIAGKIYVIDVVQNVQYPKDLPLRRRRICQKPPDNHKVKGVAGITLVKSVNRNEQS